MACRDNSAGSMEGSAVIRDVSQDDSGSGTPREESQNESSFHTCVVHSEEEIVFFCDIHKVGCCILCTTSNHSECSLITLEDIYLKLSVYSRRAKHVRLNVDGGEDDLRAHLNKMNNHFRLCEMRIKTVFSEIRQKVNEAEKTAIEMFEIMTERELSNIKSLTKDYDDIKRKINLLTEEGERLYNRAILPRSEKPSTHSCVETQSWSCQSDASKCSDHVVSITSQLEEVNKYTLEHDENIELIEERLNELSKVIKNSNNNFVKVNNQQVSNIISNLPETVTISSSTPVMTSERSIKDNSSTTSAPVTCFVKDGQITCNGDVASMCTLVDTGGEMFIVTKTPNKLQHINSNGSAIKNVDLASIPYDICVYEDKIAVTLDTKQIICYRSSDFSVIATINLSGSCWGICRARDAFIVAFRDQGVVGSVDDRGTIITCSDRQFNWPTFVRFLGLSSFILVSNHGGHEVVALSSDLRTVLFKLKHKDLGFPHGLFINDFGGIYVCSFGEHNVIEFTTKGEYVSTILPRDKLAVSKPRSIWFDSRCRLLYVASSNSNTIHTYKG